MIYLTGDRALTMIEDGLLKRDRESEGTGICVQVLFHTDAGMRSPKKNSGKQFVKEKFIP